MAESFRMTQGGRAGLDDAREVFPNLRWRKDSKGQAHIFDEKKDEFVPVNEGDYIVSIGDRFEVSDSKPRNAKKAEAPKPEEQEEASDENDVPEASSREQDLEGSNVHDDVE